MNNKNKTEWQKLVDFGNKNNWDWTCTSGVLTTFLRRNFVAKSEIEKAGTWVDVTNRDYISKKEVIKMLEDLQSTKTFDQNYGAGPLIEKLYKYKKSLQ